MMRRMVGGSFSDFSLLTVSWKKALLGLKNFFERCNFTNGVRGFLGDLVEVKTAVSLKI